jgi:hypothetical protein
MALVNKAVRLGALEQFDEELNAYQEVETRFGQDNDLCLRQQVAKAFVNKGMRLDRLQRAAEAMAVFDEVQTRFGADSDPLLRQLAGTAAAIKRLHPAPSQIDDARSEEQKSPLSGPRIRCPLCGWQPIKGDVWTCSCGHAWDTFETGGVCPACLKQWETTACHGCSQFSSHSAWYQY